MTWKTETQTDRRKCPKHNTWMKKPAWRKDALPECEQCRMMEDAQKRHLEKVGGKNQPPVRIKKI